MDSRTKRMSSSTPATAERSCANCGKKQSELSNPLKQCTKCRSQVYCSRECQKQDWKSHKKNCMATNVSNNNNSGSKYDKETIVAQAGHTVALLKALSHDPAFDQNYNAIPASASGYVYLLDFVTRTWRKYWPAILSSQQYWDLSLELEDFHGLERDWHAADTAKRLEEMKSENPSYDKDAWPSMDEEKYSDCITRNTMAASIPLTPGQQDMMGGRYQYTEELKKVCRTIINQ